MKIAMIMLLRRTTVIITMGVGIGVFMLNGGKLSWAQAKYRQL